MVRPTTGHHRKCDAAGGTWMTTTLDAVRPSQSSLPFLDRKHTIAKPGFSRWLVPPAALCVHLCIGQAYAFSVFNKPLAQLLCAAQHACPPAAVKAISTTPGDWTIASLGWIFSLAIVFLGLSAAVFGRWVEQAGPRAAMFAAAWL